MKVKNIVIVAATKKEIDPFLDRFVNEEIEKNLLKVTNANIEIDLLITGVGIPFTIFHLTRLLTQKKYDLMINAGIAGGFHDHLSLGEVVIVKQEIFGDLGIEDKDAFRTIFEENLCNANESPFINGVIHNNNAFQNPVLKHLKQVNAITVNRVHGNTRSIKRIKEKFNADIESMEGAAFFYVCKQLEVQCIQLRSISNKIEARNREKWNIPMAIKNLNDVLSSLVDSVTSNY